MKNVYKLDLPMLDQVLLKDAKHLLERHLTKPNAYYASHEANTVFKSEWITFENLNWDSVLLFYKPIDFIGRIHSDKDFRDNDLCAHPWGINWIWGGSGSMRFWNYESLGEPKIKIDECGYHTTVFDQIDITPDEQVLMNPGVYLFNGRLPHSPISLGTRYCFSLRSRSSYNIPWENIIDKFSKYIIPTT